MNRLSKYLLIGLLEQESKIVALYGGGFKPPTRGHFEVVKKTLKDHPEIDKFYIVVGSGLRNNISQDESTSVWEIYKKYLPNNIEIIKSQSPLSYIKKYIQDNPENTIYTVIGTREGDENDIKDFIQRKAFFEKYSNKVQVLNIITSGGISGTAARKAAMESKEEFLKFLPEDLTGEEQDIIFEYVKSVIQEIITEPELDNIEKIADEWFEEYGIDIKFTRHFLERINDIRNGKPISVEELEDIFTKSAEKYGEKLSKLPNDFQAVLHNLRTDINLPFVLNYDRKNDEMDLVAKTIMRKRNFQTSNPKLTLENNSILFMDFPSLIKSLTKYMVNQGMNIKPLPKVRFIKNDDKNANNFFGKTAYYDPNQRLIVLYTMNRHPKDVMRSFAHEMIHHMQNCENRLDNIATDNTNEDGALPEIEKEAYEKGNMTFRNWEDSIKNPPLQLTEGKYDKISNTISSNIFNQWKKDFEDDKIESLYQEYIQSPTLDFDVIAVLKFINEGESLEVDGGLEENEDGNIIYVDFKIDRNTLPEMWSEISMNLKDVIRHEIEHITQSDIEKYPSKYMENDQLIRNLINAELLSPSQYFKLEKEIDANLQGMYFRAKKEKRPFIEVIDDYLSRQDITPKQKEEIIDLWRTRSKALSLPKF